MNAGGLAEGVAESELFGHVKGAFTDARADRIGCFELADEGTLFLDEIANMPMRLQAKLLRVLQTGELQRVGSSRRPLRQRARALGDQRRPARPRSPAGRFREDLLYRLNTVVIHLPPLRERRDDIEPLARALPRALRARYRKPLDRLRRRTRMRAMRAHRWPGNVRELGARDRARGADGGSRRDGDRARAISRCAPGRGRAPRPSSSLEEAERVFIEKVLARHTGDVRAGRRAARHEPQRAVSPAAAVWHPRRQQQPRASATSKRAGVLALVVRSAGCRRGHRSVYLLSTENYTFEVRWTIAAVVARASGWRRRDRAADGHAHAVARGQPARRAARGGLFHPRRAGARPGSAVDLVMMEINALGDTLQRQRAEAVESTALLTSVMAAIDVAVFAFDMDERLRARQPGRRAAARASRATR